MIDSEWRREIRWPGAPDRGSAPRTGASLSVDRRARTAEAGPRDPGVPTKSRWWGVDFVGWDGVHGRRRSVSNSEALIGVAARLRPRPRAQYPDYPWQRLAGSPAVTAPCAAPTG